MLLATESAPEILRVCLTGPPEGSSIESELSETLGISEAESQTVLRMQFQALTPHAREQLRADVAEVDRQLVELQAT